MVGVIASIGRSLMLIWNQSNTLDGRESLAERTSLDKPPAPSARIAISVWGVIP